VSKIIRVLGLADGTPVPIGLWIESYDVNAIDFTRTSTVNPDGTVTINGAWGGSIHLTSDRDCARRFATAAEALTAWTTQSTVRPLRPDGKPNKPLTALTVEIEHVS
jgi:hypothetical protein